MARKVITLESREIKTLIELMDRGLAYTDAYYRDYKRMDNIFNKVLEQIKKDK